MVSDPFANLNNNWAGPIDKPNTNPISIPTGKETQVLSIQEPKSNPWMIVAGIATIAAVVILGLLLTLVFLRSSPTNVPVVPPAQPQVPIVQQPPVPPAPQQPPSTINVSALKYPGAEVKMQFGDGGMILSTKDSIEKVAK